MSLRPINKIRRELVKARQLLEQYQSPMATTDERKKSANQAERIRFQSDFSSAHWLHQVLSMYEIGMKNERRRLAFEAVIRVAIKFGCVAAKELMQTYPTAAGFPTPIPLEEPSNWKETQRYVLDHFRQHEFDRFRYVREGD